jgi:hypothetical protein
MEINLRTDGGSEFADMNINDQLQTRTTLIDELVSKPAPSGELLPLLTKIQRVDDSIIHSLINQVVALNKRAPDAALRDEVERWKQAYLVAQGKLNLEGFR